MNLIAIYLVHPLAEGALQKRVKVHFLALLSQSGGFQYFTQLPAMLDLWQSHLTSRNLLDPT